MIGQKMFVLQLAQYIVFLLSITLFTLNKLDYANFKAQFPSTTITQNSTARAVVQLSVDPQAVNCFNSVDCWIDLLSGDIAMTALSVITTVTIGIGLLLEVSQMIRMKGRYFDLGNLIDWTIFITSLVLVLDDLVWSIEIEDASKGCASAKVVIS